MKQSISDFQHQSSQMLSVSGNVRSTWNDVVGEAFYRDIIEPLKEQSSEMTTAMDELHSTLLNLKSEIDKI